MKSECCDYCDERLSNTEGSVWIPTPGRGTIPFHWNCYAFLTYIALRTDDRRVRECT